MAIKLFPHNKRTYAAVKELFQTQQRVAVVQPTGTGKSFLFLKWIYDNPKDLFVIMSPSTEIFSQLQSYADGKCAKILLNRTQFITYQMLVRMTDEDIAKVPVTKLILDEYHRTGAELWWPALQRFLQAHPNIQVFGATATPIRYLDNCKDMTDAIFSGQLARCMSLGEAVALNILPSPKYISVWYDYDGKILRYQADINKLAEPKRKTELRKQLNKMQRELEKSYGITNIFQKHLTSDHVKLIVFCQSIEHVTEMKETVPLWFSHINSNVHCYVSISPSPDKDRQLKAFRADESPNAIKLLFTVDRLNEGIHVKGIDGVIMLRPTISPIIYLQQMGRALASGEKVPLIFDMVNNHKNAAITLSTGIKHNVFTHEYYEAASEDQMQSFNIFDNTLKFEALLQEFEAELYLTADQRWEKTYMLLKQFIAEFRRFPYASEIYQEIKLGSWCGTQRRFYHQNRLAPDRIKKLILIGFDFGVPQKDGWYQDFLVLVDFVNTYGRAPIQGEDHNGTAIGYWYARQCEQMRNHTIDPAREKLLLSLNLPVSETRQTAWDRKYQLCVLYYDTYGTLPQRRTKFQDVDIGQWCADQKRAYKKGLIKDPERIEKLRAIGLI